MEGDIGRQEVHIKWVNPNKGWACLNTDGAVKGNGGIAGCGGLIRDNDSNLH